MPVCIAGMHRSGTSMIAKILNVCGLYLGPEDELLYPESGYMGATIDDNPKGYWENIPFIEFNNEILKTFDGDYIRVPSLLSGWSNDPKLLPLKHRVAGLILKHQTQVFWGWKDPRNSLTLEFWQDVFPDLKVVICVRNPVEVIDSITGRNFTNRQDIIDWWLQYHKIMVSSLSRSPYMITHYESYFFDPKAEIERVCNFIGLDVSEDQVKEATLVIQSHLHRHIYPDELLEHALLPAAVRQHYAALCQEAGQTFQQIKSNLNYQNNVLKRSLIEAHKRLGIESDYQEQLAKALGDQAEHEKDYQERLNKVLTDHAAELASHDEFYQKELGELKHKHTELETIHAQMQKYYQQEIVRLNTETTRKDEFYQKELGELKHKHTELETVHAQMQKYYQQEIVRLNTETRTKRAKAGRMSAIDNSSVEPTFFTGKLIRGLYRRILPLDLRLRLRDFRSVVAAPFRSIYHFLVPLGIRLRLRNIRVQLIGR
jgi:hypothetical protein